MLYRVKVWRSGWPIHLANILTLHFCLEAVDLYLVQFLSWNSYKYANSLNFLHQCSSLFVGMWKYPKCMFLWLWIRLFPMILNLSITLTLISPFNGRKSLQGQRSLFADIDPTNSQNVLERILKFVILLCSILLQLSHSNILWILCS